MRLLGNIHVERCFYKFFILYWHDWRIWRLSGIIYYDWIFAYVNEKQKSNQNNKLGTCIQKRFDVFILEIKVGIVCGGVGFDSRIIWKPWHPNSNGFIKP